MVRALDHQGLLKLYQDKMEMLQRGKCISHGVSWGMSLRAFDAQPSLSIQVLPVSRRVENHPRTPAHRGRQQLSYPACRVTSTVPLTLAARGGPVRTVAFPSHLWQVSSVCCGMVRGTRGSWEY